MSTICYELDAESKNMLMEMFPPYTIVGGNPAQVIKKRFPEDVIQRLLALKIYDLGEDKIEKIHAALCHNNIDLLEEQIRQFK